MIVSALKNRNRLTTYIAQTPDLTDDRLSEQDWDDLEEMVKLLKPFKQVTMLGQEKGTTYGSIASTLWGYDYLLAQLESWERGSRRSETGFRAAVNLSWDLLKRYYKETDKCPVYFAAMVLDPRFKMEYFERQWPREWLEPAKQKLRTFYSQYAGDGAITSIIEVQNLVRGRKPAARSFGIFSEEPLDVSEFLWGPGTAHCNDELDAYCSEPVLRFRSEQERKDFNVIGFWKINVSVYPALGRMFFDICAIPSMSAEPERVFSGYILYTMYC